MTTTLLRRGRVDAPATPGATAMLLVGGTAGGTVGWVGRDEDAPAADRTVELSGALVTPVFVDAHVHATQTGLALTGLDLSGARSLAEALAAVERQARRQPGPVLLGAGWDETRWPERRAPTPAELDRACPGGLVYLARVDHHSAVVSPALLAACPQARELAGFDRSGQLTLAAHHAVRAAAFAGVTPAQQVAAQHACRQRAAALGIGCLHEMAGPQISGVADLEALLRLAAEEPGPEIVGYWGALGDLDTVARLGLPGAAGDLFCDGSLGSHTAALTEPYADALGSTGHLWHDAPAIAEHVAACTRAGVQAGFHAIGDRALRAVLDGVALAAERVGLAAVRAQRHRVEHAEMPPPAGPTAAGGASGPTAAPGEPGPTAAGGGGITEFARFGLVASVQPAFDAYWGGAEGMYAQRLGADRAAALNPFAGFAAAGVPLAFGSDAPVTPLDPWGGVRAAVWHHTPGSRISPRAAFTAATLGGWQAARRVGEGVLRPGAPASYAVWEVEAYSADGLPDLSPGRPLPVCRQTVVRGVTVYER